MKVITAEAMQRIDRITIEELGVPGLTLMENAGRQCAETIVEEFGPRILLRAAVLAGKGNNGGDGYVIARLLREQGWDVHVFVLAPESDITGDAAANLRRLDGAVVTFCASIDDLLNVAPLVADYPLLIDAIFGTGLKSEVTGLQAEAIRLMNRSRRPVVAVDIPSGVHGSTGKILGVAVDATLTVTFAAPKIGHVIHPGASCCGRLAVVDIGIPSRLVDESAGLEFVDAAAASSHIRRRRPTDHKGTFGHLLVVAGSRGKSGAAAMAANSAVRAGAGLVTLTVPAAVHDIVEIKTTEAMTVPLPDLPDGCLSPASEELIVSLAAGKQAVALGPGIAWRPETAEVVRRLVKRLDVPLVLDADALNAVSEDPDVLRDYRGKALVLTPHPGEMARLLGVTVAEVEDDRLCAASGLAGKYGAYVILKGAGTVVACPDGSLSVNGSGNPGMASGGMGDVLTGIVGSLLGQGYSPDAACRLGVYLHGYAADLVADIKGMIGITATDVQEMIPYAYNALLQED